jgi:hypothetical protein
VYPAFQGYKNHLGHQELWATARKTGPKPKYVKSTTNHSLQPEGNRWKPTPPSLLSILESRNTATGPCSQAYYSFHTPSGAAGQDFCDLETHWGWGDCSCKLLGLVDGGIEVGLGDVLVGVSHVTGVCVVSGGDRPGVGGGSRGPEHRDELSFPPQKALASFHNFPLISRSVLRRPAVSSPQKSVG